MVFNEFKYQIKNKQIIVIKFEDSTRQFVFVEDWDERFQEITRVLTDSMKKILNSVENVQELNLESCLKYSGKKLEKGGSKWTIES